VLLDGVEPLRRYPASSDDVLQEGAHLLRALRAAEGEHQQRFGSHAIN
jgi:hypothetical protein